MNYNEWKTQNTDGALDQYITICRKRRQVIDLRGAALRWADLSWADLRGGDLSGADLRGADLIRANLSGANIDFSCWPLWCGSNHVIVDASIAAQLAAHFCALDCDDPAYKAAREALLPFARTSHRAGDLGLLDVENE